MSRFIIKLAATALVFPLIGACGGQTQAEDASAAWQPSDPIEFVVHASAGGGTDLMARKVAEIMQAEKIVSVPVNVTNRTGGGGAVAYSYVNSKKGDPNVIAAVTTSFLSTPLQGTSPVSYKDFTNLAVLGSDVFIGIVNAESKFKTMEDVLAAAKAKPGEVVFGGTQTGAMDEFIARAIEADAGVKLNYVPYDGDSDVAQDLLGGRVDITSTNPAQAKALVDAGRVRAVVAFSETPIKGYEDAPTVTDVGLKSAALKQIRGVIAPGGLTQAETAFWTDALTRVAETKAWADYADENSFEVETVVGEAAQQRMADLSTQYDQYLKAAKAAGS